MADRASAGTAGGAGLTQCLHMLDVAAPLKPAHAPRTQRIGRAAIAALHDELALAPKPGLVSPIDSGSHADMDARCFMRSLFALRHYFPAVAAAGARDAPLSELEALGRHAEAAMLRATGGVNTHRGAVFTLGLLCAAAGVLSAQGRPCRAADLRAQLLQRWGAALDERRHRAHAGSKGQRAARRHGLRGAGDEAAMGFPVLFDATWPALHAARRSGLEDTSARLQALLHTMAVLDDTNLAHRGGLAGLRWAQRQARAYLDAGGVAADHRLERAWALHRAFVARRLSPGGAADLLAAACWLQRCCSEP